MIKLFKLTDIEKLKECTSLGFNYIMILDKYPLKHELIKKVTDGEEFTLISYEVELVGFDDKNMPDFFTCDFDDFYEEIAMGVYVFVSCYSSYTNALIGGIYEKA